MLSTHSLKFFRYSVNLILITCLLAGLVLAGKPQAKAKAYSVTQDSPPIQYQEPPMQFIPPVGYPQTSGPTYTDYRDNLNQSWMSLSKTDNRFMEDPDLSSMAYAMVDASLPAGLDTRSLPPGMITIDLTYDVVMGWATSGNSITVTVGADGYGAAVADGAGFFWTPIWHKTGGYQLDTDCSMSFTISVEGDSPIVLTPPCLAGSVDVLNDEIDGSISDDTGSTAVTATLSMLDNYLIPQPPSPGAPEVTGSTSGDGSFTLSFSGVDLGAESMAAIDMTHSGVNIRSYFYPQDVFLVQQFNTIAGFASPGQTVNATVYEGVTSTVRWSDTTNAKWPHGLYNFAGATIEIGDTIEVVFDGSTTLTTSVFYLGNFVFDLSIELLTGDAPEGEDVRSTIWQWAGDTRTYNEFHTTGAIGDTFMMNFSPTDLRPRDEVLVVVADASGNQIQITSGPPFVSALIAYDDRDCITGRLDAPGLPITVTLDKGGGEIYERTPPGWSTDSGNEFGVCFLIRAVDFSWGPINFEPGDIATLKSDDTHWSGSVSIKDFSWDGDTSTDTISGQAPDGDMEIRVSQWKNGFYPLLGTVTKQVTASGTSFSTSFTNFDVRDGNIIWWDHYDATSGYGNELNPWGQPSLPYFELQLSHNAISGSDSNPDETITANLYDESDTLLVTTSDDGDSDPWRFWMENFGTYTFQPGYKIVVISTSGWSSEMVVPDLSMTGNMSSDTITAQGPDGLLFLEVNNSDFSQGQGAFIPTSDVLWNLAYYGWDLMQGDTIAVTYEAVDGNRARLEERMGEVYNVGTWLSPGSQDWIWGNAIPGSEVTIETDTETLTAYADPNCDGCWARGSIDLEPGDTITVTAGDGLYPVEFSITTPFIAQADSDTDVVTGQVGGRANDWVDINANWENGYQQITTNADGSFSADYDDIPRGGDGNIHYSYIEDATQIVSELYFRAPDLVLDIFPQSDSIEGRYALGHDITLKVFDAADVLKATITLPTDEVEWWGSMTGFYTNYNDGIWVPSRPDIQPGDKVYGFVDDAINFDAYAQVGEITAEVDADTNNISGYLDVDWLPVDELVRVDCQPWGAPWGTPSKEDFVFPTGTDPFNCSWDPNTEWDVEPGQDIGVIYQDEDGDNIIYSFHEISYDLYLDINYDHDWIEGWYPSGYEVTLTVTEGDGTTVKATTTITTGEVPWWGGQTGFSTNMDTIWNPERPDIQPGDWVYGEVEAEGTTYYAEVQLGMITGEVNIDTDSISGTIDASWLPQDVDVEVQCHSWGSDGSAPNKQDNVPPNGSDIYSCTWDPDTEWDIQPNQQVGVSYKDPAGHWVYGVFEGYTDELILSIHYDHEWIEGPYKAGHTVYLQVKDPEGQEKAHMTLTTGPIDSWGGQTGFSTNMEGAQWLPNHPDIQPGDIIHGEVDDGSQFWADVEIGSIAGIVDLEEDSLTGTLDAAWLMPGPVDLGCYIWEDNSPGNKYTSVIPNNMDTFTCDWTDDGWDIVPGTQVMAAYFEPAGHEIIGDFSYPTPWLQIQKQLEGGENPGGGGNATFYVQYHNQGKGDAEDVTITDTMVGMTYLGDTSEFILTGSGSEVSWDLGTVPPGDWIGFYVYAQVTADAGAPVSNTVEISTSSFDQGDPSERISTWEGTVSPYDAKLSVNKGTWTWNPAPGEYFVYQVGVCNNGSTGSASVSLTDILPEATTFDSWWAREAGWEQTALLDHTLGLQHPSIPAYSCYEVYIRVLLDSESISGDLLTNVASIDTLINTDIENGMATLEHNVGDPYTDLSISANWHWGMLVPGGNYRYGIQFRNEGNVSVAGPIEVTTTIPSGTTFVGWDHWDWADVSEPVLVGNQITWQVDTLEPGFWGTIEVWLDIDADTVPGTNLFHTIDIEIQPEEGFTENNFSNFEETVYGHGPNLRVRKWGDWHGYGEGHNAWYQLQVENVGDQTVENVVIRDDYPAEMELDGGVNVSFWQSWTWENYPASDYFTVTLEKLEPTWNVGINFNVVIPGDEPVPGGQVFTNTATITEDPADSNPVDNIAIYLLGSGPDMFVEKTLQQGEFLPGEEVTFLLRFGNAQPGHAWWWNMTENGILTDTLPDGMSYVSAVLHWCGETDWCDFTPEDPIDQTLSWTIGAYNAGAWNEVLLTVLISEDVQDGDELVNLLEIGSTEPTQDLDPFPDNNSSSFTGKVEIPFFYIYLPLVLRN